MSKDDRKRPEREKIDYTRNNKGDRELIEGQPRKNLAEPPSYYLPETPRKPSTDPPPPPPSEP